MLYQLIRTIDGQQFAALVSTECKDLFHLPYRHKFNPKLAEYFTLLKNIATQHYLLEDYPLIKYPKRKVIAGFSTSEAKELYSKWQESGPNAWSRDKVNLIDNAMDGYQRTYVTGERHVKDAIAWRRISLELLIMVNLDPSIFSSN